MGQQVPALPFTMGKSQPVQGGPGQQLLAPQQQLRTTQQKLQQLIDNQVKELNAAEQLKKLQQLFGPKEAARYSRFKEEERRQQKQALQAKQPTDVPTAQDKGGPMLTPRGKPNPMVQRKKKGPYRVQESASSRSGPSGSQL